MQVASGRSSPRRARRSVKRFALDLFPDEPTREVLFQAEDYGVRWAPLDHGGLACLGHACVKTRQPKVDPEALGRTGVPPGPWVGRLLVATDAQPESGFPAPGPEPQSNRQPISPST